MKIKEITLKKFNRELIILTILSILLFAIYIYKIKDLNILCVLEDEFGYWSIAAYFAGIDWSSATSNIAYYSYGYSFLLTPLFYIFDDPIKMYKAAIIINSILLSSCIFISYNIGIKIFPKIKETIIIAVSFCVLLYPAYIVQSNIAWSESLLIFLFWLLLWIFLNLHSESSIYNFFMCGVVLSYTYMVHQRTLGIVIAGIIVIILMYYYKRINKKQLLLFFITVAFMFFLHSLIKNNIQTNLWLNGNKISANDFLGQRDKIFGILQIKGFFRTLKVGIGHVFYIGAATFLIAYLGILFSLKQIVISVKRKYYVNKKLTNFYGLLFLIISFIFTLIINVIFMSNPNRIDNITYGRYIENTLGPIIFIGLGYILDEEKTKVRDSMFCILIFVILSMLTYYSLETLNLKSYNPICSVGTWMYYKNEKLSIFRLASFSLAIFIIVKVILYISIRKKTYQYVAVSIIIFTFIFIGKGLISRNIIQEQKSNIQIDEIVKYIGSHEKIPVYFLLNDDFFNDSTKDLFQFLMYKKPLKCITKDQISDIRGEHLIITSTKNPFYFGLEQNYKILKNSGRRYNLWSLKENNNDKNIIELNVTGLPIQTGEKDLTNNQIISNGKSGFLSYGPYMELDRGNYNFQIEYELDKDKTVIEDIGYTEVISGGIKFNERKIVKEDFNTEGKLRINIPISIQNRTENIEIRNYINDNVFINIKSINISKSEYNFSKEIGVSELQTQNGIVNNKELTSNGKKGFLTYGPYMGLTSGKYSLEVQLDLIQNINNYSELGQVDIFSNGTQIAVETILNEKINEGMYKTQIPFEVTNNINNLEFRVYTKDGVIMKTKGFKIVGN